MLKRIEQIMSQNIDHLLGKADDFSTLCADWMVSTPDKWVTAAEKMFKFYNI